MLGYTAYKSRSPKTVPGDKWPILNPRKAISANIRNLILVCFKSEWSNLIFAVACFRKCNIAQMNLEQGRQVSVIVIGNYLDLAAQ
jgi:hypothetical protein